MGCRVTVAAVTLSDMDDLPAAVDDALRQAKEWAELAITWVTGR